MSGVTIALLLFGGMLLLMAIRVPIAMAMMVPGVVGYVAISGWPSLLNAMKGLAFARLANYDLTVIPLFLLMGAFASQGGLSRSLFQAGNAIIGHLRGGLAMASVLACAAFGSICGSSIATAATMAKVALPEMRAMKYSGRLSTGALAAGGTLGIMIPPSVILILYAILAEQNIAKLFLAAFVPGVLAAIGYMIAISIYVRLFPETAGQSPRLPYRERFAALIDVWPVLLVFLAVVGGIYFGWFTPTEGAAVGAAGTGLIALLNGGLTRKTFIESVLGTASATAMIFFIVFGAAMYNSFLALSQLPQEAAAYISGQGFNPWTVLVAILILYLLLGCVMDSLSMILLTIPIFFPIVTALDYGLGPEEFAIWFGILVLIVVEVGLITPPVGMNLFVINSMSRETPILATYRGVTPFVISDIVRTAILTLFPIISLFMVRWLY